MKRCLIAIAAGMAVTFAATCGDLMANLISWVVDQVGFRHRRDDLLGTLLFVALLAGPGLIVTAAIAYRRPHKPGTCRKCGYNLTGNESGTCPECGMTCPSSR